jgi:hypothetical protein
MNAEGQQGFWTTLPGILTAIAALLTAVVGLTTAVTQWGDRGKTSPSPRNTGAVSLTVQAALLGPSERTKFSTHQVTARVTAPAELLPKIDRVTYLLPPSFGSDSVTQSSPEDGFALQIAASGSFLLQAKIYFADGNVQDVSRQIDLPPG